MKLLPALALKCPSIISVVGGGGKTSFIFTLAREAADQNLSVLITTTTAMFNPDAFAENRPRPFDRLFTGPAQNLAEPRPEKGKILLGAENLIAGGKKLKGYEKEALSIAVEASGFDLVLIEADGARMRPVKAPAPHEPVILPTSNMVVGCIGLDCLDTPLDETHVHRPEILAQITGLDMDSPVTETCLSGLVRHDRGIFKSAHLSAQRILVLNKADTPELEKRGAGLAQTLSQTPQAPLCLITRLKDKSNPVKQVVGTGI